ncbi:TauD/TfdA family dioxygenase [Nocardia sp. NPDC051900]|uniref:TauD/TfdA family dioxygenase n=1 Tax=Nocardia sp. NPDC051900 TaxID=3364326 RepID=UPI0037B50F8D
MFVDLQHEWAAGVAAKLAADGLARFDGIRTRAQLVALGASLGRVVPHRDSGPDGVTTLTHRGKLGSRVGFEGFGNGALLPHTDRSGLSEPPALLMVVCGRKGEGGNCIVIDGRRVYLDLVATNRDAAQVLSQPRTVLFGGATGYLGSIFEHAVDARIRIRYRRDELATFSPEIVRWLPTLSDAVERHTIQFGLEPGQGYVLHNHRWLHGRARFTGDRVIYRLSLNPHEEFAIPSGFAAPNNVGG